MAENVMEISDERKRAKITQTESGGGDEVSAVREDTRVSVEDQEIARLGVGVLTTGVEF